MEASCRTAETWASSVRGGQSETGLSALQRDPPRGCPAARKLEPHGVSLVLLPTGTPWTKVTSSDGRVARGVGLGGSLMLRSTALRRPFRICCAALISL